MYMAEVVHERPRVDVTVRGLAEGHDLPEDDPEGPDVGLGAELALGDRLRRHPLDRDLARGELAVVVGGLDVPEKKIFLIMMMS